MEQKGKTEGKLHIVSCWEVFCSCKAVEAVGRANLRHLLPTFLGVILYIHTHISVYICVLYIHRCVSVYRYIMKLAQAALWEL